MKDRSGISIKCRFVLLFMFCISILSGTVYASNVPYYSEGIYSTTAEDGAVIKIYRYKPAKDAVYRTGGTPVLLFSGITSNMNEFLSCTPEIRKDAYAKMHLPDGYADWAIARDSAGNPVYRDGKPVPEPYLVADPMKYYSIAYYLWSRGFDPWFANYRDTGRDVMRSSGGGKTVLITLDTWLNLDVPAAIAKVKSVTGKRLYIGGHSTGGYGAYAYLQGCYMDAGGTDRAARLAAFKKCYVNNYQPHVKSDVKLAVARNADVKGFIALDPAGVPPLPSFADIPLIYSILTSKIYIPLDAISEAVTQQVQTGVNMLLVDVLFGSVMPIDLLLNSLGMPKNIFAYFDAFYVSDTNIYVQDFLARYGLSGLSLRCLGQFAYNGIKYTNREFWMNGYENRKKIYVKDPDPGNDGYYYYSEHMKLVTVPTIYIGSSSLSMVNPDVVADTIMSKKTASPLDESHVIKGTSHIDLVMGLKAPSQVFPALGAWLAKVEASDKVAVPGSGTLQITDTGTDDGDSTSSEVSGDDNASGVTTSGGCGTIAEASVGGASGKDILPGLISTQGMMLFPLFIIMIRRKIKKIM